ncbi:MULTISPECIES: exodeoxyribonuclease VII large subunit [Leuconostoc]|uniref:Exodeoxyribonuclease 7 large subunit n=1 Tax=Leuconostoc suionicum TaxID=1511761 RepID=A0A2N9K7F3_9LACO|nr:MULTISPECIES: exodeoxyribonuclease VII large subunit [Leuconostoc]API72558.1 exodeoxyribonuclease VII large subunit [Leuconostoc suionicum]MBE4728538.1 exodeoxyribonuclease VII large subunit [Leuconostoc suionicum]MCT4403216.1 exodeoxyribonuclease VII large subunit [Leuconostoc suionicum]MDI6498254.1 exodeoxyribonuclease VII large subunit [Leuconostoc suionicum]MDI6500251.1 exodeoxyribonuclease VII large subunit [Leuconostoc suionicum]
MEKEQNQYLTVSALSAYLKRKFDADPYLAKVYVTGEISNMGRRRGPHLYFSIKDSESNAVINASMFGYERRIKFQPEEGMKINAIGRVEIYEPRGSYSIILESMTPDGVGELFLAYEQLKRKLQTEGLFDLPKKQIPLFPKKIAVITSPTGAVIEDIARTVQRRFPSAQVILFPAVVQGEKAAPTIIRQLQRIDNMDFDTLIVGRGGGSIEDLWAFNDENLARTVASMQTPVISSVGHETDNTLVDFVSDRRAATPTAAAELATPVTLQQLTTRLQELHLRQISRIKQMIDMRQQRLNRVATHVIFQQPDRLYTGYNQRIDQLSHSLQQLTKQKVINEEHKLSAILQRQQQLQRSLLQPVQERLQLLSTKLDLVSPLKILSSGYAIVEHNNKVVRSTTSIKFNDEVDMRFSDGHATAKITGVQHE